VLLDPPLPFGLVKCSNCGQRVWFLTICCERTFFRYEAAQLVRQLFHGLPADQQLSQELGFDRLDAVELVVDFESALQDAL